MRNISFSLTTKQFEDGTKDVTRRIGWDFLNAGDKLMAVERAMGLKKGEKMKRLGAIEIISVRLERIDAVTQDECRREGFPHFTIQQFIDFFCEQSGKKPWDFVRRIEFRKLQE